MDLIDVHIPSCDYRLKGALESEKQCQSSAMEELNEVGQGCWSLRPFGLRRKKRRRTRPDFVLRTTTG